MRRFELLIARGRIGLLLVLQLKADALLCSLVKNKRRPLCHICSCFITFQPYYYMLIALVLDDYLRIHTAITFELLAVDYNDCEL